MKAKKIYLLFFPLALLLSFSTCSKDDSNPVNNSDFSAKGSDYFPVTSGTMINARVSGSATEYDSLGVVTEFTQISNEIYNGTIGALVSVHNLNVNPIFGNDNGKSHLIGYLSSNNGEIVGFDEKSQNFIILPSELTVGKEWIVNPQSPMNEQIRVKLVEVLSSFTNSAGKVFQNTINLSVVFKDSIGGSDGFHTWYDKVLLDGNLYFSKGKGIVGIKLNDLEEIRKENYHSTAYNYNYYKRTKANGAIGITD